MCHVPLSDNRLMNSNCWLDESSSLLRPRMTPVRLCHVPLSDNGLMNSNCWLNESSSLLMRATYYSSVPVPCAAGRQQAHEFELLTGGMFLSIMTRIVTFHFSLSRSAKPKHTQLLLKTSALCDLRMSRQHGRSVGKICQRLLAIAQQSPHSFVLEVDLSVQQYPGRWYRCCTLSNTLI